MNIISFQFLFFLLAVFAVYFLFPRKWQWTVLTAANLIFYCFSGVKYLLYLLFTSLVIFYAGILLEKTIAEGKQALKGITDQAEKMRRKEQTIRQKKRISLAAILLSLGIWAVLKYQTFLIGNLNGLLHLFSLSWEMKTFSWIVPLGMSYYVFQEVGYLVDVYRGKYAAEKNYGKFLTFVSFFPHIIQGPFSRFNKLGASLFEPHSFSYDRLCQGCSRILWGFFKKLIIADKIGILVAEVIANYTQYSRIAILWMLLLYGIQLYADFSAYMDIVCGVSRIMGISLEENFRQPYFARSIDEFWRRWHITLGSWLRDYVFYPLSIGKVGRKISTWARGKFGPKMGKLMAGYFALFFVWGVTGLWHGANWASLVWGYVNLVFILVAMQMEDRYIKVRQKLHLNDSRLWTGFCIVRTFVLICLIRVLSITDSLSTAMGLFRQIFLPYAVAPISAEWFPAITARDLLVVLAGTGMLLFVDIFCEMDKWETLKQKTPFYIRDLVYACMILMLILFAGGENDLVGGFMYARF